MKTAIKTILLFLFISQTFFAHSQDWPKYFGEPDRKDYSYDIIETYDKGYLICGGYFNEESTWSWLIKTNINGDTLWEKILECTGFNYLKAIHPLTDGGVIACGAINYGKADPMPYVLKLNECGEKVWCKSFYSPEPDVLPWAQDIKETQTGDIIVLVNTFGDYPEETMHLFKLNANGDVIWKKPYCSGYVHPEGALPLGESIHITSEQNYLICGSVYWEDPWNPGGLKTIHPTFTMVNSLGNEEWVLPYGLMDTIVGDAYDVIEKSNNTFVGIASYWPTQNEIKPIFVRFDNDGNEKTHTIIDVKDIDTSFSKGHLGCFFNKGSFYYASGTFELQLSGVVPNTDVIIDTNLFNTEPQIINHVIHNEQYWPYTFDSAFNNKLINNSTFKETGNWDIALSKLNLNLEYDTLDPGNYTYDSLCATPGLPQSGFIYLDDCDIITGIDIPSPEEYYASLERIPIIAYPNPTTQGTITFEFENTEHHTNIEVKCFGIYGKEIHSEKIFPYQGRSVVDVSQWLNGIYVAVVYSDDMPVGQTKFVVLLR